MARSKHAKKKKNKVAVVASAGLPNVVNKKKKIKKKVLKEIVKKIYKNDKKSSHNTDVNRLLHPKKSKKNKQSNDSNILSIPINGTHRTRRQRLKDPSGYPQQSVYETRLRKKKMSSLSIENDSKNKSSSPQNINSNNTKQKTPNKKNDANCSSKNQKNKDVNISNISDEANSSSKKRRKKRKSIKNEKKNHPNKKQNRKDDKNDKNKDSHNKNVPISTKKNYSQRQASALTEYQKKKKKKNEKKKQESRRKSIEQSIQSKLPPRTNSNNLSLLPKLCSAPWFHEEELLQSTDNLTEYSHWFPPLSSVHETAGLDILEQELHLFSKYVGLSPEEVEARLYFLDHVNDLAQESFGGGKHKQNSRMRLRSDSWGKEDEDDDIRVEVFGSFATLPICNFTSDVDMALWGVVKTPQHKVFTIDLHNDDSNDKNSHLKDEGTKMLSQSSLLRTMDALKNGGKNFCGLDSEKENRLARWRDALSNVNNHDDDQQITKNKNESIIVLCDDDDESDTNSADQKQIESKACNNNFFKDLEEGTKTDLPSEEANRFKNGVFVFDKIGVPITIDDSNDTDKCCSAKTNPLTNGNLITKDNSRKDDSFFNENKGKGDGLFEIDRGGITFDVETAKKNSKCFNNINSQEKNGKGEDLFVIDRAGIPTENEMLKNDGSIGQSPCGDEIQRAKSLLETDRVCITVNNEGNESKAINDMTSPFSTKKDKDNHKVGVPLPLDLKEKVPLDLKEKERKSLDAEKKMPMIVHQENQKQDNHISFQLHKDVKQQSSGESGIDVCLNLKEKKNLELSKRKDYQSNTDNSDNSDHDDDDSADKMASFKKLNRNTPQKISSNESTASLFPVLQGTNKINTSSDEDSIHKEIIEISSSSAENDSDLQVSGIALTTSNQKALSSKISQKAKVRPRATYGSIGRARPMVISALRTLSKKLWRSEVVHTVELRSRARVPIIALNTKFGFESDIALGGHNGTDTSLYATHQIFRFKSFPHVILLLKTLLRQTDLDKPFTGGLGSYKLYVIVAKHLENHLAMGGTDRPSEILLSFLFRFGNVTEYRRSVGKDKFTSISQNTALFCDGGEADLSPVFKIDSIVSLFGRCFRLLLNRIEIINKLGGIKSAEDMHNRPSILSSIVKGNELERERVRCKLKSLNLNKLKKEQPLSQMYRNHPGKVTPGRKVGYVFCNEPHNTNHERTRDNEKVSALSMKRNTNQNTKKKSDVQTAVTDLERIPQKKLTPKKRSEDVELSTDEEAEQLMAGYGVKRGPRGGLIPKTRPDVEARNNEEQSNPMIEVLRRGSKNRKNKKKQKRDKALKQFADSELRKV